MSKKLSSLALLFSLSLIGIANASADYEQAKAVQLDEVNTAIHAYGANWTAKENWVSQLSIAEVKRMLGARNVPNPDVQFLESQSTSSQSSATVLDWRAVNGVNWVTPIKNQGNCGSCVAFAAAGTLETQMNISAKFSDLMPDVSTEALFECGGGNCNEGWEPAEAQSYLSSHGVPDEACLPYTSGATGNDVACSAACSDIASRSIKTVPTKSPISTLSINSVKAALAHGPLVTTLTVYADFLTYSSGVYKHVTGAALGGHAVSIVGYDDTQQAWIVRNSWGSDWGDNGFILVSYNDTSGVAREVWSFDLPSEAGYLSFETPTNDQILSGVTNLQIASTVDANSTLNYTILDSTGKVALTNSVHGVPENIALDTTTLKDGQYQIFANAVTPTNVTVDSLHVEFYVLNSQPKGSLSFTPQGFNITKPLSGRVVFNVAAPSAPVPFSTLTLHIQQDGKDVYSESIDTVLPSMTFGWRTTMVPNGQYNIFMVANIAASGTYAFSTQSPTVSVTVKN